MNECYSIDASDKTILSEQTKFELSEIIGIKNYFYQEINQRKSCSKKLNKYVTAFDYIDKILIVLSATSSGVSIASFTIVAAPVGIASASLTLIFFLTILTLAKSKLSSIKTLRSQALTDMDISHEEFGTILKEKDKYEKMKETLRSENEEYKIMRLSSMKSKI